MAVVNRVPKPTKHHLAWPLSIVGVCVAAFALVGFYIYRQPVVVPDCGPGSFFEDGSCKPGADIADRLTRCIVSDQSVTRKAGTELNVEALVKQASMEAKTLTQLRENFEKTVTKTENECVLLDANARCFAAITQTAPNQLPERCR